MFKVRYANPGFSLSKSCLTRIRQDLIPCLLTLILIQSVEIPAMASPNLCSDNFQKNPICYKFEYLQSQLMALGAQRELRHLNFSFIEAIAKDMKSMAQSLPNLLPTDSIFHMSLIKIIEFQADLLGQAAQRHDQRIFYLSQILEKQCSLCHEIFGLNDKLGWSHLFSYNWDTINQNCRQSGRKTELCLNMNGLLSTYSLVVSGLTADIYNYNLLRESMREILQITDTMITQKLFTSSQSSFQELQTIAKETLDLAEKQNPMAFERAQDIPNSCISCHNTEHINHFIPIRWHSGESGVRPFNNQMNFAPRTMEL